jgi:aquaporin Z
LCILGVTQRGAPVERAIGLTLIAIHLFGLNITGTSVNPARALGPAIVGAASNPHALAQMWLFIVAPLIGAGIAGILLKRGGALAAEDVTSERGKSRSEVPPAGSAPTKRK